MVLFNQVRVWVSVGSIFVNIPYLAVFGPFLMSFFEIGRQILKLFIRDELNPQIQGFKNPDGAVISKSKTRIFARICDSLIDAFTPQTFLIVEAISQQCDWMRNGRRKMLEQ